MAEINDGPQPAKLKTPLPGTVLTSNTVTFSWTPGTSGGPYGIHIGTSPNNSDIYSNSNYSARSLTLTNNAFMSGNPVYINLVSHTDNGGIIKKAYTFETGGVFEPAQMISPIPGSLLEITSYSPLSSDVNLEWTPGIGVEKYWVHTVSKNSSSRYRDLTVPNLHIGTVRLFGSPFFVELWSLVNGQWFEEVSQYETDLPPALQPISNQHLAPGQGGIIQFTVIDFNTQLGEDAVTWSVNVEPHSLNYTFIPSSVYGGIAQFRVNSSNPEGFWRITVTVEDKFGLKDQKSFTLKIGTGPVLKKR